jgi:hypothetical protein
VQLDKELITHLEGLLRPLFLKQGLNFLVLPRLSDCDDLIFKISWELRTDRARQGKRSKLIVLKISAEAMNEYEEAINEYKEGNRKRREQYDSKLRKFIEANLYKHDSEHNQPIGRPTPEVQWLVSTDVLNS